MRMNFKHISVACCTAFLWILIPGGVAAQVYKAERENENKIIDVVSDFDSGRYTDARRRLESILNNDERNDAAHYYMGLVNYVQGDLESAEAEIQKAVKLDTTNFWYRYRLAGIYAVTDRQELTVAIYEDLLRDFPKKSDLYFGIVDTYLSMGKMEEALEVLDQIETVMGRSEAAVMTKFDLLRSLDREEEAFRMLEEYNEEYSSPQVLSVLGDYYMSVYNDSTAIAYYDEALDIYPGYAPALLGKAETYRITRRYPEYFTTLNEFVSNEEISSEGKCDYLELLVQKSDPRFLKNFVVELDDVMDNCLEVHPKDSTVNSLAGIYYYTTGRDEEARTYFKRNVDDWPESLGAAEYYAEALMYTGELEELSSFAKASYENFPQEYRFIQMSIYADYNLEDYDSVIRSCQQLIDLALDETTMLSSYSTMGDSYYKAGESARAYKTYEAALKIDSEYVPVLNNYAYFLSLDGKNLKKAATMSRITVEAEPDNPTYLDTYGWILYLLGKYSDAKVYFKHAMVYGAKDNAVIMDHYAEVLYALGEYDQAFYYWNQALAKDSDGEIEGLSAKVKARKNAVKR